MYYTKTKDSTLKEENIHPGRHESDEFTRKDPIRRGFFKFCFRPYLSYFTNLLFICFYSFQQIIFFLLFLFQQQYFNSLSSFISQMV